MSSEGNCKTPRGSFPPTMIIQPRLEHRQSFIILHGRGSTADKFAPGLLSASSASENEHLQSAFPHAKLVFPTASSNRATIYKRSYTHQWFDNWHLEDVTRRQDLMRAGLRTSVAHIHSLLQAEIEIVGKGNVVLWGLSQGCATSLSALLAWDGEPFAAVVGMCGWMPFSNILLEIARVDDAESAWDPFACDDSVGEDTSSYPIDENMENIERYAPGSNENKSAKLSLPEQAVVFFRNEIEIEGETRMACGDIPVFLGHGMDDDKVSIELGREAQSCLELIGIDVQLVEYANCGHSCSSEMLRDIFIFLRRVLRRGEIS